MRIIGGHAGGRRLAVPPGHGTRPTADRMREALFSAVDASEGTLAGRRFLDLYAGSGAVGLEAWSRGASAVLAVERDIRAGRVVRHNVDTLGAGDVVQVRVASVARLAQDRAPEPYDVIFADPPYELPLADLVAELDALRERGWIGDGALVVVERASRDPDLRWPAWVEPLRSRAYGEGTLWYGRVVAAEAVATQSAEE